MLENTVALQEEAVLDSPGPELRREIATIRKRIVILRRYLAPQRDALRALSTMQQPWLTDTDRLLLQEIADRVVRHVEDLDMLRDRGQLIRDELSNVLSDRQNQNLYVLALLSGVFLPLGFITGLLGVNVGGIPGSDTPWAFAALCVALGAAGAAVFIWLRRRGWI